MLKTKLKIFLLLVSCMPCVLPKLKVNKKSSKIKIRNGANFSIDNPVTNYKGTLEVEDGGTASVNSIDFAEGIFDLAGNIIKLTGKLNEEGVSKIVLDGSKVFKGKRGSVIQALMVKGKQNKLEGFLNFSEDVELENSDAELAVAVHGRMPTNILLNGGKIKLEENLYFVDDVFFQGSGTIELNRRKLILGCGEMYCSANLYFDNARDIELNANLHLSETWTFSGESILQGNGKILYLEDGGNIVIEAGSALLMQDVTIRNISDNNIRCLDENATITFQNVNWIQDGNYSFTVGSFNVTEKLTLKGSYTFAYQTAQTSTVHSYGKIVCDRGLTFSFDPIYNTNFSVTYDGEMNEINRWDQARNFLALEDESAVFELKGATLYVTTTGMKLTKGNFRVKDRSYIMSDLDGEFHLEEGFVIGNNDADDDVKFEICGGSLLDVTRGALSYKNVNSSSCKMDCGTPEIYIGSNGKIKLHQTLDVGSGVITFWDGGTISRADGKSLLGAVSVHGSINHEVCYN